MDARDLQQRLARGLRLTGGAALRRLAGPEHDWDTERVGLHHEVGALVGECVGHAQRVLGRLPWAPTHWQRSVPRDCGRTVGDDDRLVGMITDRDIVVRAIAQGKSLDTKVAEVMSKEMLYCFETDGIDDVARNMAKAQIRRLPVVNHAKRLVGIVSLGDLARNDDPTTIGRTVSKVSTPGGKHDQTTAH